MDKQQLQVNTEDKSPASKSGEGINIVITVLLCIAFLAISILASLIADKAFKGAENPTALQTMLYTALSGVLIGLIGVSWLYYQTNSAKSAIHPILYGGVFTASASLFLYYMITMGWSIKSFTTWLSSVLVGLVAALVFFGLTRVNVIGDKEAPAWYYPVFGGALTLVMMALAYVSIGMWPVGRESAMIVDMHHQYAPMLSQLRDMLLNGGNALYTFDVGSGTSFIPLFAYYLASPFNLILVFFPQAYLAQGILLITLIKMMLTGAFMTLCIQYIFKRRNYSTVAIGVMYALMMYMLAYSWDIMWLDCVMVLPLCVMGFEMMMRQGKYLLYVLSLAYVLYSNYYIGFMVCIFLVLYYAVFFFRAGRNGIQQSVGFARFAIGSLLGGGLAAFILVPAFLSLSSTSAAGGSLPEFGTNFNVFELFGRSLFGVKPTIRSGNLPNTYCGVLAMLTLPVFATMNTVSLRRRLSYLGLFFVMTLSMVINQFDLVWHGLHSPNDLPYRYSFIFSFVLLLIAAEVLYRIESVKPIQIGGSIFGIVVYLVLEENFGKESYSNGSLYISFLLIVIYGLIMLLVSQKKMMKNLAYLLLMTIVSAELLFNSVITFRQLNSSEHFTDHAAYLDNNITNAVQSTVDRMEQIGDAELNGDFYRVEFAPRRTTTDTALFDYHGITIFASSGSYNMTRFMGSLGYDVNGVNSVLYQHYVPTADSLVGIRYIAFHAKDYKYHPKLELVDSVQVGDDLYYIYKNPYALSVGYMVNEAAKDWTYSYYDPMASQNSLYKALTQTTDDVLQCEQIESTNATVNAISAFSIPGKGDWEFTATASKDGEFFVHVDCRAAEKIRVTSPDDSFEDFNVTHHEPYIVNIGHLKAGTKVNISIETNSSCGGNVFVASLNEEVFKRDIEMLSSDPLVINSFSDGKLQGTIHVDEKGTMMTSIEYDKGWTVKVDGKVVPTYAVGGAMLAIDLEAGDHVIEMSFFPRGLVIGATLSVLSLLALILLLDYIKRRDTGKGFLPFLNNKKPGKSEEKEQQ